MLGPRFSVRARVQAGAAVRAKLRVLVRAARVWGWVERAGWG